MKKKITLALVMILIVVICATIFAGCDQIFQKNETRDETQVVATVNYGSQTANIYKYELEASFNNYAYYYTYYYSMTYEEAADYILNSLAQQKLLTLYAIEKVAQQQNVAIPSDISTLLSAAEIDHAINEVNDSLLESLKTIVENAITEDNYNNAEEETEEDVVVADDAAKIYVKFNSQGGSDVDRQQIKVGQKASEPTEPTYSGYKFYGWYENLDFTGDKIDFSTRKFTATTTLYAKWVEYIEPRTVKEEVEEEDDYDPDDTSITMDNLTAKFFSDAYQATLYDEIKGEDFVEDMMVAENTNAEKVLKEYISDGVATLKKNITTNLYKDSYEECYNYYLNSQYESLIVEKYKRLLGNDCSVTDAEVESEYSRLVKNNKETFGNSNSSYSSALTSSLSTTYYHNTTVDLSNSGYGFVQNILLKLNEEDLAKLTEMITNNPSNKEAVVIERNRLISNMEVNISNPSYYNNDDKSEVEKEQEDLDIVDPMTDKNNKYNDIDENGVATGTAKDTKYEVEGGNNYSQIISFEKIDDKYQIVYNATEAPTMAYLLKSWPAFDKEGKVGIIHQIQNTFDQVMAATDLDITEQVYWLNQVANEWLYLVGDDSGSVTSSSNNNGLGYLITPEGEDSSYLTAFTDYARALICEGTGTYKLGTVSYDVADLEGNVAGNEIGFVLADSFIESGSTSSAYAGVFILNCSYKVWDTTLYNKYSGNTLDDTNKTLPIDYILTFEENKDDVKTIKETIRESLLESKKTDVYNTDVNTMIASNENAITTYKKIYKSIWKDLDAE